MSFFARFSDDEGSEHGSVENDEATTNALLNANLRTPTPASAHDDPPDSAQGRSPTNFVSASDRPESELTVEQRLQIAEHKIVQLSDATNNLDDMFIFSLKSHCIVASTLASEHEVFSSIAGAGGISKRMQICGVLANSLTTSVQSLSKESDAVMLDDGGAYESLGRLISDEEKEGAKEKEMESQLKYAKGVKKKPAATDSAAGSSSRGRGGRGRGAAGRGGGRGGKSAAVSTEPAEPATAAEPASKGTRTSQLRDVSTPSGKKAAAQEAAAAQGTKNIVFEGFEVDASNIKRVVAGISLNAAVGRNVTMMSLAPRQSRVKPTDDILLKARIDMNKDSTELERRDNVKMMGGSIANFVNAVINKVLVDVDGPVIVVGLRKRDKGEKDADFVAKQGPLVTALIRCAGLECGMNSSMDESFATAVTARAVSNMMHFANQLKVRQPKKVKKTTPTLQYLDTRHGDCDVEMEEQAYDADKSRQSDGFNDDD